MSTEAPSDLIELANRLADAGGDVIRPYFRQPIAIDTKADASPVTIADREAEQAIRAVPAAARPDDGIIGEECGSEKTGAEYVWVIDPIDGTKSFITGRPIFGTLIALVCNGAPILGVIDQPISGERWIGLRGHGATLNGNPIRVRECPTLADATIGNTALDLFDLAGAKSWQQAAAAPGTWFMAAIAIPTRRSPPVSLTPSSRRVCKHTISRRWRPWSRKPAALSPTGRGTR